MKSKDYSEIIASGCGVVSICIFLGLFVINIIN